METLTSFDRVRGWMSTDTGGTSVVRRCIRAMAIDERLPDSIRDRAVLVGTELATNLQRHAVGGELFVTARDGGLDLLSLDRGPGIPDLEAALRDGFSTAGGLGDGMGICQRQSDQFEIQTGSHGTLVRSRIGPGEERASWGVVERAYPPGYEAGWSSPSGDAWRVASDATYDYLLVVDALGHGRRAASAAEVATSAAECFPNPPDAALAVVSRAIGSGRGAVGAALRIDRRRRTVEVAIVGNVAARILGPTHGKRVASRDGILGPRMPTPRVETCPLPPGHAVLIHTDGVSARRRVQIPDTASALMQAAYVYRAGARFSDDACVMAYQLPEEGAGGR